MLKTSSALVLAAVIVAAVSCKNPGASSVPAAETGAPAEESATGSAEQAGEKEEGTGKEDEATPDPRVPLPEEARGAWCFKKLWSPPHESPHFWGSASFDEEEFSVSQGEESKDSGSWSVRGSYTVTGGSGTDDDPFVLSMTVIEGGGSDTHGYPADAGPGQAGDVIEGKVWLGDGTLTLQVPGETMSLARPPCEGE